MHSKPRQKQNENEIIDANYLNNALPISVDSMVNFISLIIL